MADGSRTPADYATVFGDTVAHGGSAQSLDCKPVPGAGDCNPANRGWYANRNQPATFTMPSSGRVVVAQPLREGVERFMVTDINNAAASAKAQSSSAIMWDNSFTDKGAFRGINNFNHIPGGANILYMDGHVEWAKFPQPIGSAAYVMTRESQLDDSWESP